MDKVTAERLQKSVEALQANTAFMATPKEMEQLQKDGLVESNDQLKEGNKIAFRATQKGLEAFQQLNGGGAKPAVQLSAEAEKYEIESDIPPPEGRRRTGPKMKYPFDRLEVGQSFFVEATTEKPEPWKNLASTVSTAMRRYAVKDGTRVNRNGETVDNYKPTRVFRLDKAEKNGKDGARIWRVA